VNKNLKDGLNFTRKLNALRIWNAMQVVASYIYSRASKKPVHWGMPLSLSFEPTTSCNLRCPECPSGLRNFTRPIGMAEEDLYKKLVDELHPRLIYLLLYFQGEPFLHPKFLDYVRYASSKGIYTATSTNAHYLKDDIAKQTVESGLDRLIISIDGTTQESYASYRVGGKLSKVIEGTRNLVRWKKELKSSTPHIIFQFLVVKPNEHQIEDVKKLAKELGADEVGFKTAQIYDYEQGSPLIPTIEKYSRYKQNSDGTWSIKNKMLNHCWKMWHSAVVTWDGKVVPCCFDKDAWHQMGNISTISFAEVWRSTDYQKFRASLIRSRSEIEMCKNCTEGTKVWA
jgi:radical SAM protein with 4Fe4S-binding SPASM domain